MSKEFVDIVDFHSHLLPCADHGSSSLATSLEQVDLARQYGVKRIFATPHFYPHRHTLGAFLTRRASSAEQLLPKLEDKVEIKLGAEVLLCDGLDKFCGLDKLCLSDTNVLLLELPFSDFRESYCNTVGNIIRLGYDVVLAHVDRYPRENIEKLIDIGVNKMQLNAESLAKFVKKKHLFEWIERGYVVAIGSDIHGADKKAYKRFLKAVNNLTTFKDIIKEKSDKIWYQQ